MENFFIKKNLQKIIFHSKFYKKNLPNKMQYKNPYAPNLKDLYNLYQYIILNKRTTVLELGSGWSSLIIFLALQELKNKWYKESSILRRSNLFELFVLENEKKFLTISKNRIKKYFKQNKNLVKINYNFSNVQMTEYNGNIATEYVKLPICNPDFIYIDGPDQFNVKGELNGITTAHNDFMPMTCDLLKIEYFLLPGTIVLIDGRGANAAFLKDNLKRNWTYKRNLENDQHIFFLNEKPLGKVNEDLIKFSLKK